LCVALGKKAGGVPRVAAPPPNNRRSWLLTIPPLIPPVVALSPLILVLAPSLSLLPPLIARSLPRTAGATGIWTIIAAAAATTAIGLIRNLVIVREKWRNWNWEVSWWMILVKERKRV